MSPHAALESSRKRPAEDDVGEVVHVRHLSPPLKRLHTSHPPLGTNNTKSAARTSRQSRSSAAMPSAVKEGNPTQRISRAKKGKRVHGCNHPGCEKIFTRAEHLRRHQLNHNTDVFFKCDMCDRTFVRHDLLLRHQERHASQAMKAVQTLALAQRHRNFSTHYAINSIAGLPAQPPSPGGEYGGNAHMFDPNTLPHPHNMEQLPQGIAVTSPPHSGSPVTSLSSMSSGYTPAVQITHHNSDSSVGYASDSTPSPSGSIGRGQLPYQLGPGDMQRQQESYMAATELMHRPAPGHEQQSSVYQNSAVSSWDSNMNWLFDDSTEKPLMEEGRTVNYIHPLEMAYSRSIAHPPQDCSGAPPPPGVRDTSLIFHHMDENMRTEILHLLGNVPNLQASSFASLSSMTNYLRLYWNNFHPLYPILHRPSFMPGMSMVGLAAIVVAIGASFADPESHQFAMALYDAVKAVLINSNEYSTGSPNSLPILQTLMLTDIFGKLRTTREQFDGAQLDMILAGLLRREGPPADALAHLRTMQREGRDYHLESEWHHWIQLEGRKRMATLFFFWDVQQAVLFGRDACQIAFELQAGLMSGKEEILWDSNCASDWINCVDTEAEVPTFLGVLKVFFDQKKQLPHISPLASCFILHGLISVALDLKRSLVRNPEGGLEKQGRLLQAFERWRQHYEKTVAIHLRSPRHNKIMVMYHMAFVTMHTNLHQLYTVAGDTRLFARNPERIDYYHAKDELTTWANSPAGQLATWHAVQIIVRMIGEPDSVREQVHMPFMQYVSLLVCWAYGTFSTSSMGGQLEVNGPELLWDSQAAQQGMQSYLQQMNTRSWQEITHARNFRRTTGLIASIRNTWQGNKWGVLEHAAEILRGIVAPRTMKGV